MPRLAPRALLLSLLMAAVACGTSTPTDPGDGGGGTDPVANPEGVLLEGGATTAARDAVTQLAPSPALGSEQTKAILTTRLVAMLKPDATVAEVNGALENVEGRILSMQPGSPFVTLKVPAVADESGARQLAATLRSRDAFLWVAPARLARAGENQLRVASRPLQKRAAAVDHLRFARILPAWNVADLGVANQDRIPVLMPDEYASSVSHSEIDAQRMVGYGVPNFLPGPDIYPGNTGFVLAGIVGANVDDTAPTGTSPQPVELLDIRSMPVGGLSWNDIIWMLAWQIAGAGDEFVLHSALEFNDPNFADIPALDRAMQALAWRVAVNAHQDKFLTVVPTPADPEELPASSPFRIAAAYPDLRDFMQAANAPTADIATFEAAWTDLQQALPSATQPLTNTITVGAAFLGGPPADVLASGDGIVGPCVSADPSQQPGFLCDGDVAFYGGNSMASAQVAGLAAYMMSLSDASPAEIRERVLASTAATGMLDGYTAVLGLDSSTDLQIHEALLDVASFESPNEDGKFDQWDLQAIANGPQPIKRAVEDVLAPELRYDFNGDGQLGQQATARVDLNLDGQFGTVTQDIEGQTVTFDENAVRDIDVVCYYAYSAAYRGDLTMRGQYLVSPHTGLVVEILDLPERITVPSTFELRVRAGLRGESGAISHVAGVDVDLHINGGDAEPREGVTDDNGYWITTVTIFEEDYNEIEFEASASSGGDNAESIRSVLRQNEIKLLSHRAYVGAGLFGTYNRDVGIPGVRFLDDFEFIESTTFDAYDETMSRNSSGSGFGINVSGTSSARGTSRVDLVGDDQLRGFYVTSQQSASLALTNPNFDILSYQANSYADGEFEIDFVVYGEPATFTMHGSTGATDYDVELDGDSDVFVCDSNDSPCSAISTGGPLAPGRYSLSVYHSNRHIIRWYEGCTDCNPTSGTKSSEGSLSVNFEISHGG